MYNIGLANFDAIGGSGQGGMTEDQVKELINKNNEEVVQSQIEDAVNQSTADMQTHVQTVVDQATSDMQSHVDTVVADAAEDYDDTKIYDTYDAMIAAEPTGREDVLYIITNEDNTRYIWNGTAYTAIEGRIGRDQIENLFNSL